MFTKQDYINYFNEIKKIENKLLENIIELKTLIKDNLIKDNNIQEIMDKIYNDEQNHIELEEEIIKYIPNKEENSKMKNSVPLFCATIFS